MYSHQTHPLFSFFLFYRHKQTHSHFQGWENATLPLPVNTEARGGEKKEGGREGEGWDKIHQIWWHGDVDNVFSFQLSSEKRRQNTTTFTLSHPLFWMKGSTMYRVCVSNVSLCAQTPCPFTYQNDCPTIMWFNGKTHILLIWLSGRGSTGLQSTGGEKRKKKKKERRERNYPVSHLFAQIRQKTPSETVRCYGNLPHRNIGKQMRWGNVDGFFKVWKPQLLGKQKLAPFVFYLLL